MLKMKFGYFYKKSKTFDITVAPGLLVSSDSTDTNIMSIRILPYFTNGSCKINWRRWNTNK